MPRAELLGLLFFRPDGVLMRSQFRDRWGTQGFKRRTGRGVHVPDPTPTQAKIIHQMHGELRTQVAIAEELGVPRSRIRIWYARRGFLPLSRLAGHLTGRADTRARAE